MAKPQIVFDPYASAAQREVVDEIINRRSVRLTGHDDWYPMAFFLKTDEGEILGGLLGQIWARWLYVGTLTFREPFRGHGHGTKLLARAEEYALDRGCTNAWLSTFSFQARPFYERLGYSLFGALDNFPEGHSLFFMTKRLATSRNDMQGEQGAA
jgi:GNAT superfamily N-acetyltransferase